MTRPAPPVLPRYGKPPLDCPPEVLFRRLLVWPRPSWPVDFHFEGIQHQQLTCTALRATEVAQAEEAETDLSLARIMARSLRAGGLLVFQRPEELFEMPDDEYDRLQRAFFQVFFAISPVRGRCDWVEWSEVLLKGADHVTNHTATTLLGGCYDVALVGRYNRIIDRPERYWGCRPAQLTDGHIMLHHAARRLHDQRYSQ